MAANVEGWSLEGVNLADMGAYIIEDRDGWDVQPGRRGEPIRVPYRHGAYTVPKKYLDPNRFSLTIVVAERLQGGGLPIAPEDGWTTLQANQERLAGLLYSDNLLDLRRTMADGTERQAIVEMYAATPWRQRGKQQMEITCLFVNSEASWRELPLEQETGLVSPSAPISVGGNAPVGDSVVFATATATGGPYTIQIGDTTATIAAMTNGDKATIDSGARPRLARLRRRRRRRRPHHQTRPSQLVRARGGPSKHHHDHRSDYRGDRLVQPLALRRTHATHNRTKPATPLGRQRRRFLLPRRRRRAHQHERRQPRHPQQRGQHLHQAQLGQPGLRLHGRRVPRTQRPLRRLRRLLARSRRSPQRARNVDRHHQRLRRHLDPASSEPHRPTTHQPVPRPEHVLRSRLHRHPGPSRQGRRG